MLFAHGLDGGGRTSWAAFPDRVASALPELHVATLHWPAQLHRFMAEPAHTIPALSRALVPILAQTLQGHRRVHLVLHCLGGLAVLGALHRVWQARRAWPHSAPACTLIDAPLLAPVPDAPTWLRRVMVMMGLADPALTTQAEWLNRDSAMSCTVIRGNDADWVGQCSPFAAGNRHHTLALSHTALALAPPDGSFAPLSIVLAALGPPTAQSG